MMLLILAVAALVTSILSAIIGMGGGILLLAVMLTFLSHAETIPAHGAVQLVSNGTRLLAFSKHVDWALLGRFAIGAVPGSALGGLLLMWLRQGDLEATEPYLKLAIGVFVLWVVVTTKDPTDTQLAPVSRDRRHRGFVVMLFGFFAGALGLTVGAVGPLIAPLFLREGLVKERLIATKATCQATVHFLKLPVFLSTGLVDYANLGQLILIMSVMTIPGTLIGKKILTHVNEQTFGKLFRLTLVFAGIKVLCYDGIYQLVRAYMGHS